ncbi:MAG TPA: response regulator [Anaerolineae bacterium]|nr:response regulator [Anaerolineae bacterium]
MSNVLVVEDDMLNRILLSTFLQEDGHTVILASDGEAALEQLKSNDVDVILLDLVMPKVSGYEVLEQVKQDEQRRHIPVIVISATDDIDNVVRCIEMGAMDYLTKPFNVTILRARINASLMHKRLVDMEQAYTRDLQAQNKELDAFARTVAHDLKTPLAPVIGMGEMLMERYEDVLDDKGMRYLGMIVRNGRRMVSIINALLLLASLRDQQPEPQPLDMDYIVYEVESRLQYIQEQCGGVIKGPDSWPLAVGYGPWIEEVWTNYISNAFKYGGEPPLVEVGGEMVDGGMVRFWVRDNGKGLTEEQQEQLFTDFTRFESKKAEGHGLGLSIVERIVTKLGGGVGVESVEGEGCTFWFTLPALKPE